MDGSWFVWLTAAVSLLLMVGGAITLSYWLNRKTSR